MNELAAAVFIYDGECAYCSVAASASKRLDDVEAILWYDDAVRVFFDTQFADVSSAMVLVDRREDCVYAGRAAVKELTDRAGMSGFPGNLVRDSYDRIARVVGVASGCGHDPDDAHSVYDLEPDTVDLFTPLLDNAES